MRFHRTDGHKYRKNEIAKEGESQLLAVHTGSKLSPEYAQLDQPACPHSKPEKSVGTECGHTKGVVMLAVLNAGE
ncbi:hypothetical protein D3C74_483290 [compost metagenome]